MANERRQVRDAGDDRPGKRVRGQGAGTHRVELRYSRINVEFTRFNVKVYDAVPRAEGARKRGLALCQLNRAAEPHSDGGYGQEE